nr:selenium cofactor biosynthesis protein YqeC [Anaerolineae bacterium]
MSPAKISLSRALRISSGDVVALVGGGGKTSAMFRLANELSQASPSPLRVLVTTTTRIFATQIKLAPSFVTFDPARQSLADLRPDLQTACEQHGQVLLIGQADAGSGKALGVAPGVIDALAASGWFDVILIEADGSRMHPFKAPAKHEPQIPASTTLVVPVVGIDALGRPLADKHVHRASLVSQLSHTPLDQPVTL